MSQTACRRPVFFLLATILAIPGPLTMVLPSAHTGTLLQAKKRGEDKEEKEKPRLRLVADPYVGFTPVTAILTGHLTGVDRRDPNFCHPAVTWIRIDPGQTEDDGLRIREDPACTHPGDEISVEVSYSKTFVLTRPGSYLVRLIVEGKHGTRVQSGFTKVQVLRVQ
jgi:hypothetical protein